MSQEFTQLQHRIMTHSIPLDVLVARADTAHQQRSPGKDDQGAIPLYTISGFCLSRQVAAHIKQGGGYRSAGDVAWKLGNVRIDETDRESKSSLTNASSKAEKRIQNLRHGRIIFYQGY